MAGVFGPVDVPSQYAALIQAAASRWNVPPQLLAAQIEAESGFNPNAVSPAGAIGISQFMPSTAASLGVNPRDPASAIDGMARLMAQYFKEFGSWDKALIAYHDGPGGVDDPGPNARNYVAKILGKVGGLIGGSIGALPDALNPLTETVALLQKIRDPAFLKRLGTGALGAFVIAVGVFLLVQAFAVRQGVKLVKGVSDGGTDAGSSGTQSRNTQGNGVGRVPARADSVGSVRNGGTSKSGTRIPGTSGKSNARISRT